MSATSETGATRLDSGVRIVLLTRLVPLIAAPVTLLLVATQRSVAEQGLYFIFWNVQALAQLMEVGVGSLIVQFASHESPSLGWNERGALVGDVAATRRLYGVTREGVRWYTRIACAMFAIGGIGGTWLLQSHRAGVSPGPLLPWIVTIATTVAYLPVVPLLCTIEGCGGLLRVQGMRFIQVSLAMLCLWSVLPVWGALWGVAAFSVIWLLVALVWLMREHFAFVSGLLSHRFPDQDAQLGPRQWRTGMMWIALWIAPQVLTPIVLAIHGSSPAGQVGMSIAIATAPLTLASAWLAGRYPRYGAMLARGAKAELAHLAMVATLQAIGVFAIGSSVAIAAIWLLGRTVPELAARAMSPLVIGLLSLANLAWLLFQSIGGYLRAWRQEPLAEVAVAGVIAVAAGTWFAALHSTPAGTVAAYSIIVVLVVLPLAARALSRHRRVRRVP